jgi:uncharacterized protein
MDSKYIRTFSGFRFHTSPKPDDFCITDIARGLAVAPRWGGHSKWRYPVAAHSMYVALMLPVEYKLEGLMHDASEAYFCDLPSPFKAELPEYKVIENKIMFAAANKFGFDWPMPELVKIADAVALQHEHAAFFDDEFSYDIPPVVVPKELTVPNDWNFSTWEDLPISVIMTTFIHHFNSYAR